MNNTLNVNKYEIIASSHCPKSSSMAHLWSNAQQEILDGEVYSKVICLNKNCNQLQIFKIS